MPIENTYHLGPSQRGRNRRRVGMRLSQFVEENTPRSREDFLDHHPSAFLLVPDRSLQQLQVGNSLYSTPPTGDLSAMTQVETAAYDVTPLIKKARNSSGFMISVGRAGRCDIVIKDQRISAYHAFFRWEPDSPQWTVIDAGSSHGLVIDGQKLSRSGMRNLQSGIEIDFAGALPCIFYTASGLYDYLHLMGHLIGG